MISEVLNDVCQIQFDGRSEEDDEEKEKSSRDSYRAQSGEVIQWQVATIHWG